MATRSSVLPVSASVRSYVRQNAGPTVSTRAPAAAAVSAIAACWARTADSTLPIEIASAAGAVGKPARRQRAGVEPLEAVRLQRRVHDPRHRVLSGLRARQQQQAGRLDLRQRVQPQRQLADDAERAERADQELGDVVAGHRLDHLGAAPGGHAVGLDEAHAEQQIAHGAVAQSERTAGRGGADAAERAPRPSGRIQRQRLPSRGERGRQRAGRHARLHRHGQVVRAVLQHRVQAREIEHHVDAIRRAAERPARCRCPAGGRRALRRGRAPARARLPRATGAGPPSGAASRPRRRRRGRPDRRWRRRGPAARGARHPSARVVTLTPTSRRATPAAPAGIPRRTPGAWAAACRDSSGGRDRRRPAADT